VVADEVTKRSANSGQAYASGGASRRMMRTAPELLSKIETLAKTEKANVLKVFLRYILY
jgi:hypothetical protein